MHIRENTFILPLCSESVLTGNKFPTPCEKKQISVHELSLYNYTNDESKPQVGAATMLVLHYAKAFEWNNILPFVSKQILPTWCTFGISIERNSFDRKTLFFFFFTAYAGPQLPMHVID